MTKISQSAWLVMLVMLSPCTGQVCVCDDACIRNRVCSFGSEQAYTYAVNVFFNYTGCPDCLSEPGDVCQCDDCNNTASDIQALLQNNFNVVDAGGSWKDHPICKTPIMKAIMNFNAYPGDGRLIDARKPLYQLCATSNGILQAGQCDGSFCHSQVPPVCEQEKGVSEVLRFLMSLFIILCVFLFTWGSEENMAIYFSVLNTQNSTDGYTKISMQEPSKSQPSESTPESTPQSTASFLGAFL